MSSGLADEGNDGILTALYVSFVTLATLGYGDIVPTAGWLRILAPAQAAVGFGLLTASLTWVITLHSAVARQRSFAHRARLLLDGDVGSLAREGSDLFAMRLLDATTGLSTLRQDLLQYPLAYYFHDDRIRSPVPETLLDLRQLAGDIRGQEAHGPVLRKAAEELWQAVEHYAEALEDVIPGTDRTFLVGSPCGSTPDCTPIPDGVQALVDLLQGLDAERGVEEDCASVFPG